MSIRIEPNLQLNVLHKDISFYVEDRKGRVDYFLENHFGLKECIRLQRRHLLIDLLLNPINALWAVPYLSIKKVFEILDQLGWQTAKMILQLIPSTFKTYYQKEVERLIAREMLSGVDRALSANAPPSLAKTLEKEALREVSAWATKQAGVADLASSAVIYLAATRYFGDSSLNAFGMGRKVASLWAKDEAASGFIFGKSLGNAFYSVAPPQPSNWQVFLATTLILLALAALSTVVAVVSAPVQRKLGMQRKSLGKMWDAINDRWILKLAKETK